MNTFDFSENFTSVVRRIRNAEISSGREPGSVELVAVGKLHSAESIRKLAGLGQIAFAENFVQEAIEKQKVLSDLAVQWHFIGSIQSNKTRLISNHFSWVHSVERYKIARRLSSQRPAHLDPLNICLQVNLQQEQSKSGITANEVLPLLEQTVELPQLTVRGLMIVPKPAENPEDQRPVFAQLRKLLENANDQGYSLDTLSMGMTDDLEAAIAEGATHVRIGTALFGPRIKKAGL